MADKIDGGAGAIDIKTPKTLTKELIIQERIVTTDFIITEIHENIQNRVVRAQIELGPFVEETGPRGITSTRGSGRRNIVIWEGDEYDIISDTWTNDDLLQVIKNKLGV